jgi:hypothetical protein
MLIALAIFAGLVVYMTTMLCLTYMLSLIIHNYVLDFRLSSSPSITRARPMQAPLAPLRGPLVNGLAKSPDSPALFEPWTPDGGRDTARAERATAEDPALDLGASGASLHPSDGLEDVLGILHRSVGEVFPANLVTMKCSGCGHYVSRFEGYRHIKTGDRRTFCEACHRAMGLPLRASEAS